MRGDMEKEAEVVVVVADYEDQKSDSWTSFKVEENPPIFLCIIMALQQGLTSFGGNLAMALIICPAMCVTDDRIVSEILCTIFFVNGIFTFVQTTLGIRLPIVQGSSAAFVVPAMAILSLPMWKCEPVIEVNNSTHNETASSDDWMLRMRELQGGIILASTVEIVMGFTGMIGFFMKFIGPLTIAPAVTLMGVALYPVATTKAATNWPMALFTIVLLLMFSLYMARIKLPCYFYTNKSCRAVKLNVFSLFPVILAITISWIICAILTLTEAIPDDKDHWAYSLRTDTKMEVMKRASWFRVPYPLQWGMPTFSVTSVLGMLAGILSGMFESVGDYCACARIAGAPVPPSHAINRGIFVEGLGNLFIGLWGTGGGTTSYGENIGAIGITKVASRRVIQFQAVFYILMGTINKLGALFVTIPEPVVGGVFLVVFGMIAAIGVSNLQLVDMNSSRNLCIFGFSVFMGLSLPFWLQGSPDAIQTGNASVDQVVTVLLSTSMFVGAVVALILDNTVPSSDKRGEASTQLNMETIPGGDGRSTESVAGKTRITSCSDFTREVEASNAYPVEPIISDSRGFSIGSENLSTVDSTITLTKYTADSGSSITCENVPEVETIKSIYDLPLGMSFFRNHKIFSFIPVSPTFTRFNCCENRRKQLEEASCCCCCGRRKICCRK